MSERAGFKTKFGLIAAIGGSVVGLGNIWRFPYMTGEYGGAAFILVYILICLLISVPIMISEMTIGRLGQSDVVNSFRNISGKRKWGSLGFICILSSFVLLSFYCVLGGWSLHFVKESILNNFSGLSSGGIETAFNGFVNTGWEPVVWTAVFVIVTAVIVVMGIEKGIEKYNKVFMPMIILILLGMFIYSFSMSGFKDAISFLFTPDFSKITPFVVLQALGQSFFSLSIGMGTLITYGSYIKKRENIGRTAVTISMTDMGVAVLSGLAIFPAVFSMGISPTEGPNLVFITLPSVFNQMSIGYFISIIFFSLLFVAAVTSSISLLEVIITYMQDEFKMRRKYAVSILLVMLFISCSLSAVSQVDGSKVVVAGMPLFDFFNNASGIVLMPLGGLITVIFAGWVMTKREFNNEVTNDGKIKIAALGVIRFLVKFVIPIFIVALFLNMLNVI